MTWYWALAMCVTSVVGWQAAESAGEVKTYDASLWCKRIARAAFVIQGVCAGLALREFYRVGGP